MVYSHEPSLHRIPTTFANIEGIGPSRHKIGLHVTIKQSKSISGTYRPPKGNLPQVNAQDYSVKTPIGSGSIFIKGILHSADNGRFSDASFSGSSVCFCSA